MPYNGATSQGRSGCTAPFEADRESSGVWAIQERRAAGEIFRDRGGEISSRADRRQSLRHHTRYQASTGRLSPASARRPHGPQGARRAAPGASVELAVAQLLRSTPSSLRGESARCARQGPGQRPPNPAPATLSAPLQTARSCVHRPPAVQVERKAEDQNLTACALALPVPLLRSSGCGSSSSIPPPFALSSTTTSIAHLAPWLFFYYTHLYIQQCCQRLEHPALSEAKKKTLESCSCFVNSARHYLLTHTPHAQTPPPFVARSVPASSPPSDHPPSHLCETHSSIKMAGIFRTIYDWLLRMFW